LCLRSASGDHVYHAIDGVGAHSVAPGPLITFDSVNVFEQRVLCVPKDAREQRRVDGAPVNKDQKLVCDRVVEAACADRVLARVDSRHLEIGRESQRLGRLVAPERRISSPVMTKTEAGASDKRSARRGYRCDLEVGELLQAQVARSEGLPV